MSKSKKLNISKTKADRIVLQFFSESSHHPRQTLCFDQRRQIDRFPVKKSRKNGSKLTPVTFKNLLLQNGYMYKLVLYVNTILYECRS